MAVLTLPGAEAVLAAQVAALPQPDQLCGPFSARAALHAVLDPLDVPSLVEVATAAGTSIWPHDVAAHRPAGGAFHRTGWDVLPTAPDPGSSGTHAAGLARGVVAATGGAVAVVPVSGVGAAVDRLVALLVALAAAAVPVGVVANVATAALDPGTDWDVGHFVVLWALDAEGARVAVADTYPELGAPGEPPGCRWVPLARLAAAISAPPGRGLLLLAPVDREAEVAALVTRDRPGPDDLVDLTRRHRGRTG